MLCSFGRSIQLHSWPRWTKEGFIRYFPRGILVPAFYHRFRTVALCKSHRVDPAPLARHPYQNDQYVPLQWRQLWKFIKSDVVLLLIAVAVSYSCCLV